MRQEYEELLLKELCARLPHNVKCYVPIVNKTMTLTGKRLNYFCFHDEADGLDYSHEHEVVLDPFNNSNEIVKPYLRPISSLAEKEQIALGKLIGGASYNILFTDFSYLKKLLEHVYKNHIDIFGLIPKGLAIKVTEENNPYKKIKL